MTAAAELDDPKALREEFRRVVNMTAAELEKWLATDESKSVGITPEGKNESVGHHSGRRIVQLLHTKAGDLDEDDLAHMRKVVGYVHRHLKQKPAHPEESRWRWSLMNWGHDPMKKG
jgi:hypothetical protein